MTRLLRQTLAAVDVESTLQLEGESGGELEGTETVTALTYVINGKTRRVAVSELGGLSERHINRLMNPNLNLGGVLGAATEFRVLTVSAHGPDPDQLANHQT